MELKRSWENYVEHRNSFVYGYSEIDLNDFADLVQDTFDFFKYVKDNYLFPGKAPKSPVDTFSFLKVLFYVSQYRNYDNAQDESENFYRYRLNIGGACRFFNQSKLFFI